MHYKSEIKNERPTAITNFHSYYVKRTNTTVNLNQNLPSLEGPLKKVLTQEVLALSGRAT